MTQELLTVLLLVSVQILQGLTLELWNKKENNLMEYDDNEMGTDGNQNIIAKLVKKIYPATNNVVKAKSRPLYETTTRHGNCSCKLKFDYIELGRSYFPRFIQMGSCEANPCEEHYECIERKYVVKLLKRKDSRNPEGSSSYPTIPKILRDSWTTEDLPVTVACDRLRGFQMVYQ